MKISANISLSYYQTFKIKNKNAISTHYSLSYETDFDSLTI